MINLEGSALARAIIHNIGNKYNSIPNKLSVAEVELHTGEYDKLYPEAFSFFEGVNEFSRFYHHTDIELNEMYAFSVAMLSDEDDFVKVSQDMANHLFEQSNYPNIATGDVLIGHIKGLTFEGTHTQAIVIVKCENRFPFFVTHSAKNYAAELQNGINLKKFDKACLIIFQEEGFKVLVYEKKDPTNYWQREFLNVELCSNDFNKTKNYMSLAKDFVVNALPEYKELETTDKIDYLNKTVEYFRKNESFNEKEFLNEVFEDTQVIKTFKDFKKDYVTNNELEIEDGFDISDSALKKQARVFKSVLKLDKNFHVYIHGDKSLIEKGYDAKVGKHYYKIYFDEEN